MTNRSSKLQRVVETYLSKRAPDGSLANLVLILQKHEPEFINLLRDSTWLTKAVSSQVITTFITSYVVSLVADELLNKIIDLLEQLDLTQELALLSGNRVQQTMK